MDLFKNLISPFLDSFDSEKMHHSTVELFHLAEKTGLGRGALEVLSSRYTSPLLKTTVAGLEFENPLIVAAGWDKNARAVRALYHLGFASVEVGTVVEYPQPGNPKPRQFIIAPGVCINALGFNSEGMDSVATNLEGYGKLRFPLGINIGKNKDVPQEEASQAYSSVAAKLHKFASYIAINVSSPNTPGLRKLQDKDLLAEIVSAVNSAQTEARPTFIKIAPELTFEAIDDVIDVARSYKLAGIIATNTTNNAETKAKYGEKWRNVPGGLSGDDDTYRSLSTEAIRHIYSQTRGELAIIGVGGIKDTATALEKLAAGASLLQIMTAMRSEGPTVASKINRGLVAWMKRHGVNNLREIVGATQANLAAV